MLASGEQPDFQRLVSGFLIESGRGRLGWTNSASMSDVGLHVQFFTAISHTRSFSLPPEPGTCSETNQPARPIRDEIKIR